MPQTSVKISYAITVCNEFIEIQKLVPFLLQHKRSEDEICVLLDKPKASTELLNLLYIWSSKDYITLKESTFQGHFADWKNELTRMCKGDIIVNIDADELPSEKLIEAIPHLIQENPDVDVMLVPRVNTVENLTPEHIAKWGWQVTPEGWVNWPDYQWRIYKNSPDIKWINKVHERLEGFKTYTALPSDPVFALFHPKTIERQERQNEYYDIL
jgi:hypothetical protein